jgi:hypothetical protein
MNKKVIVIIAVVIIAVVVSALFLVRGGPMRWFFMGNFPRGNFTLNQSSIDEVSGVFENAQTQEDVTSYCANHRIECGYYCRNVNPSHEMCSLVGDLRNMGGVSG